MAKRKAAPPERAKTEFAEQSAGPLGRWLSGVRRTRKLEVLGNDVPCGSCIACCRASMFIHVRPEELDTLRHIPKQLLFPAPGAPKGHVLLGFDQQGQCPMLQDGKCSIYEHRPQTCRDFDCRIFSATKVGLDEHGPQAEIGRRARSFRFELSSDEERRQSSALEAAATFLQEQRASFPEGLLPHTPVQLALLAIELYELFEARLQTSGSGLEPADRSELARAVLARLEQLESARRTSKRSAKPARGR